jgi:hypothetical protein
MIHAEPSIRSVNERRQDIAGWQFQIPPESQTKMDEHGGRPPRRGSFEGLESHDGGEVNADAFGVSFH